MKPTETTTVATRFICAIVLHVYLQNEIMQGFINMKYALNHPWKFERPYIAFLSGFMQALTVFVIECVNYILLLTKDNQMDIVLNFLTLAFISQFDEFFYQSLSDKEFKKVLSGLGEKYENFLKV